MNTPLSVFHLVINLATQGIRKWHDEALGDDPVDILRQDFKELFPSDTLLIFFTWNGSVQRIENNKFLRKRMKKVPLFIDLALLEQQTRIQLMLLTEHTRDSLVGSLVVKVAIKALHECINQLIQIKVRCVRRNLKEHRLN